MHKQIKDLQVGDQVKSWNVEDHKVSEGKVIKTFTHRVDSYYILNDKIKVTEEHPFYVRDPETEEWEWVPVKDLKKGNNLIDNEGSYIPIESISEVKEELDVYNIEVEGHNNYFAEGVLVHNKRGRYYGSDTKPGDRRKELNSAASSFNTTVWDSARNALDTQIKELQAHNLAVGSIEGLINDDGTVNAGGEEIPVGAAGDLVKAVREAERTRLDTLNDNQRESENATKALQVDIRGGKTAELATIGQAYQEQQKAINSAMEKTGMADVGERFEMDNQVAATAGQSGAQRKATEDYGIGADVISTAKIDSDESAMTAELNTIAAAKDTLKAAEATSLAQTTAAVKAPMDTHTGVVRPENKALEGKWDKARSVLDGSRHQKNFSGFVDKSKSTYVVETGYPTGRNTYSKSADKPGYALSLDLKKQGDVTKAMDWLNTKSGTGVSGYDDSNTEDATALAKMWEGAANPDQAFIQVVGGKSQPGTPFSGTSNGANHFIKRHKKHKCFAGETAIEVMS